MRRESTFKKDKLARVLAEIDSDPVLLHMFAELDKDYELRQSGFEFEITSKFSLPNSPYILLPCKNEKVDVVGTENLNRIFEVSETNSGLEVFEKIDPTKPALVLYEREISGRVLYQI